MADLNQTPSANRVHIAFFGKRNAGKSSVVNAVTGQNISIVSDVKGTTTDPVQKAMELLPLGPVVIIDTPGMDDEGTVGELRVQRARQVLNKADIAVLVIDGTVGKSAEDLALQKLIEKKGVPYISSYCIKPTSAASKMKLIMKSRSARIRVSIFLSSRKSLPPSLQRGRTPKLFWVTYLSAATTWCSSRPSIPPRRKAA